MAEDESKNARNPGPADPRTGGRDLTGPPGPSARPLARAGAYSRGHSQAPAAEQPSPAADTDPRTSAERIDGGELVGQTVAGRYRVLSKLGEGGMGTVYLAEHVTIEKKVALKVLLHDYARKQDLKERFLQEAKAAARIGHENIVDITDFGDTPDGSVFFAMEYLGGTDLSHLIRNHGPIPWSRAKPILLQICRALGAAHAKGIIHRDMKPENIYLIEREGRADFVKVLDFGIAKMSADDRGSRLTRTGMIFGTPEYMSPEQAQGNKPDHRVDIYAIGVIMYEMLTARVPFKADTFMGILTKHIFEQPVPPSAANPEAAIPNEAEAIVLKAMSKERDDRFQSMAEMAAAIAQASGRMTRPTGDIQTVQPRILATSSSTALPVVATPIAGTTEAPDVVPTSRGKIVLVVACVLILAAAVVVGIVLRDRDRSRVAGKTEPAPKTKVVPGGGGASPDAAGKQPARVRHKITIETRPAGAEILLGDTLLGRSPGPVELDHADADVTLTLRLAGHKTREIRIRPDRDSRQELQLPLEAQPGKDRPKPPVKGKKVEKKVEKVEKVETKVEKKVEKKVERKVEKVETKRPGPEPELINPFEKKAPKK